MMSTNIDDPVEAWHCVVYGRVQGVGFRYSTLREAQRLRLTGWVRNRWDGSVEVYIEGKRDAVNHLLKWLSHGPPGAFVERVEKKPQNPTGSYDDFSIAY